jgi:uncharacterized membrane protein YjgN (DUF898 family)
MDPNLPQSPAATDVEPQGKTFRFDGGAGSFFAIGLGASLLYVFSFGLALPWCVAMYFRWQSNHTIVNGRRLIFTGTGGSLFGQYLKWWLLCFVTLGIYSFWVWPRMIRWATERQEIGPRV